MKKITALIIVLAIGSACAVSLQGTGTLFKKDAKAAAQSAVDAAATAKLLLKAGNTDAQVEEVLRKGGQSADQAARIVAVAKADIAAAGSDRVGQ